MIEALFTPELVMLDFNVESTDELFEVVSKRLVDMGYVKDSFVDALKEREHFYPTGLKTLPFPIAVPHADVKHVNRKGIVFVKLSHGITVNEMASSKPLSNVKYFFFLLINEAKLQVELLQYIMSFCMDDEKMSELDTICDKDAIVQYLNSGTDRN